VVIVFYASRRRNGTGTRHECTKNSAFIALLIDCFRRIAASIRTFSRQGAAEVANQEQKKAAKNGAGILQRILLIVRGMAMAVDLHPILTRLLHVRINPT
jgi:hypothetical protein